MRQKHHPSQRHWKRPVSPKEARDWHDHLALWASLVGVPIIAASTLVIAWEAMISRRQLDFVMMRERPWLRAGLAITNLRPVSPTKAQGDTSIYFENFGTIPATEVHFFFGAYDRDAVIDPNQHGWGRCPQHPNYPSQLVVLPGERRELPGPTITLVDDSMPSDPSKWLLHSGDIVRTCVEYRTGQEPLPQMTLTDVRIISGKIWYKQHPKRHHEMVVLNVSEQSF